MEILVVRYREGDVARASASWSLANCCDVLTAVYVSVLRPRLSGSTDLFCSTRTIQNVDRDVIMDVALELSSSNNGEKVRPTSRSYPSSQETDTGAHSYKRTESEC